jgi:hypothetical protein
MNQRNEMMKNFGKILSITQPCWGMPTAKCSHIKPGAR